jgi:NADH-quinone oxidoreductase subunit E
VSIRRLDPVQPPGFAFTPENLEWAEETIKRYPPGKQASAVIPILWRAQEQNGGWVSEPAIRYVADLLGLSYVRVYEVATFYTMFQLSPVGRKAHVQVCGTTPCMLMGAEALIEVCRRRIAPHTHELSPDGDFSWEEVECLGACVNAPMVQIFKDTYEDLTPESFERILDEIAAGRKPKPGPQVDRQFSAPIGGPTTLTDASIYAAPSAVPEHAAPQPAVTVPPSKAGRPEPAAEETAPALKGPRKRTPKAAEPAAGREDRVEPPGLHEPRDGRPDNLKLISGIGPKIEKQLHEIGIFHFDQIAAWTEREIAWVDGYLFLDGRLKREEWVRQAQALASGGPEEYERVFGRKPGSEPSDAR